jgi:hypothetical protein
MPSLVLALDTITNRQASSLMKRERYGDPFLPVYVSVRGARVGIAIEAASYRSRVAFCTTRTGAMSRIDRHPKIFMG